MNNSFRIFKSNLSIPWHGLIDIASKSERNMMTIGVVQPYIGYLSNSTLQK